MIRAQAIARHEDEIVTKAPLVSYEERRDVLARSQQPDRPTKARVGGLEFQIDLGVFSPAFFESSAVFASLMDVRPSERWLEIGAGCGALSVLVAKRGAGLVVATDITDAAVANITANANLHDVSDRITAIKSDVYDNLPVGMKFDTIFWNSPWMVAPDGLDVSDELERSISDPGYQAISRFLGECRRWLAPQGRLLLGFANFGDEQRLDAIIREARLHRASSIAHTSNVRADIHYVLYQLSPMETL